MSLHHNVLDRYVEQDTRIHNLDPRVKIVLAVVYIVSNALLPIGAWWAYAASLAFVVCLALMAKFSLKTLFTRSLIVVPFLLAAVTVIFNIPGKTIWTGPWGITATDAGIVRFLSIFIRSWLSVNMAVLLTATTQFPDLLHALRHLKVPAILVAVLAFMYRYLFVLTDEVNRLLRARSARSAAIKGHQSGGSIRWRANIAGSMVGQLFSRSLSRSDRVFNAMLARGYQGKMLTINPHVMKVADWAAVWVAAAAIVAIQVIGRI